MFTVQQPIPKPSLSINSPLAVSDPMAINLHIEDEVMLKVAADGFYVRGVKLEQDEHEARKVYDSFMAWLAWAQLTQKR